MIAYERAPSDYYLRTKLAGQKAYATERLQASSIDEAVAAAPQVFVRLHQPVLKVSHEVVSTNTRNRSRSQTPIKFEVQSGKAKKGKSEPIKKAIEEFLAFEQKRCDNKRIVQETFDDRAKILRKLVLPYLTQKKVTQTQQIKVNTFDDFDAWRSGTSESPITRNHELRVTKFWVDHWLVKHQLIDPQVVINKLFLRKMRVTKSELDANPPIVEEDWRKITDYLRDWENAGKNHSNHRVHLWRVLFRTFCLVMKNSGIRPNELLNLRWRHVIWESEVEVSPSGKQHEKYVAHIQIPKEIAKTGVAREVPVGGNGSQRLREWKMYLDQYLKNPKVPKRYRKVKLSDFIFGQPSLDYGVQCYSHFGDRWRKMREELEDDFRGHPLSERKYTVYSMRSTFAEQCLMRDPPVEAYLVAKWCGHDIKILNRHYERMNVRSRSRELTATPFGQKKDKREYVDFKDL